MTRERPRACVVVLLAPGYFWTRHRTSSGDGRRHVCSPTTPGLQYISFYLHMILEHGASPSTEKSLAKTLVPGTPHALRFRMCTDSHQPSIICHLIRIDQSWRYCIHNQSLSFIHFLSPKLLTTTNPETGQAMPPPPLSHGWLLVYLG
jgi:hypothetical protein